MAEDDEYENVGGETGDEAASAPDDDPTSIRSLAVAAEDVVDAFVYTRENPGTAVLRMTPPFHGRMRARLHVYRVDDARVTGAVHVAAADLLTDDVVGSYPTLEEVADRLSDDDADPETETDRIRETYADALEAWRERARESIVESVVLEAGDSRIEVDVKRVG